MCACVSIYTLLALNILVSCVIASDLVQGKLTNGINLLILEHSDADKADVAPTLFWGAALVLDEERVA